MENIYNLSKLTHESSYYVNFWFCELWMEEDRLKPFAVFDMSWIDEHVEWNLRDFHSAVAAEMIVDGTFVVEIEH